MTKIDRYINTNLFLKCSSSTKLQIEVLKIEDRPFLLVVSFLWRESPADIPIDTVGIELFTLVVPLGQPIGTDRK